VASGLAAFFAVLVYGYARFGRAPQYHTWGTKALAPALALSLVPLLSNSSSTPFHFVVVCEVLSSIEQMAIATLLPDHIGEVASVWHAWRMRKNAAGAMSLAPQGRPQVTSKH